MTLLQTVIDVALAGAVVAAILFCLYHVAGWARRRQKRAYAIGAALAPFMALGNVVDPDFRIVHEAKQHKKEEEDDPGDPPNEDEAATPSIDPPPDPPKSGVTRVLARRFRGRGHGTFA